MMRVILSFLGCVLVLQSVARPETAAIWITVNVPKDAAPGEYEEGNGFRHDFSPVEKYFDAALKNGIKPSVILMYDWEPCVGGGHKHSGAPRTLGNYFTVYAPKTGRVSEMEGPVHGGRSPGYPNYPDDYLAFWRPVYDGIYRVLKEKKLADAVICHGLFKDGAQPSEATVRNLKQITPWAVWADQNHGSPTQIHGEPVGYDTTVWNAQMPVDPAEKRTYGWQRSRIVAQFDRDMGTAIIAGLGPGIKRPRQTQADTIAAFVTSNWQERSRLLYARAAEVADALGR